MLIWVTQVQEFGPDDCDISPSPDFASLSVIPQITQLVFEDGEF